MEMEMEMEMEMSASMTCIPNDVIFDILLRLPAKTLIRLRWACKYWFDLISSRDSSFAKMHLVLHHHHNKSTTIHEEIFSISIPYLLIYSKRVLDSNTYFQCHLNCNVTANGVRADVSSQLVIPVMDKFDPSLDIWILGSCNGLILLCQRTHGIEKLCIWNPCTKEYRILPIPPKVRGLRDDLFITQINYGFGYDCVTGDYKVIRIAYYKVRNGPQIIYWTVQVYTLGTNSWRSIRHNLCRIRHGEGLFVNGALYWMDYPNGNIISFDIVTEKYRQVSKKPVVITDGQWNNAKLQVFEGSLCVVLDIYIPDIEKYRVEMWVMKDYGMNGNNNNTNNEESLWTKLFTFRKRNNFQSYGKPLRFTKNGEIFMVKYKTGLYDPKSYQDKTLYRNFEDRSHFVEVVCAESLVSLNSSTYTGNAEHTLTARRNKSFISKLELIQYPIFFIFGFGCLASVLQLIKKKTYVRDAFQKSVN